MSSLDLAQVFFITFCTLADFDERVCLQLHEIETSQFIIQGGLSELRNHSHPVRIWRRTERSHDLRDYLNA